MKTKVCLLALVAVLVALVGSLSACSTQYTDPSMVALRYAGGLTEGGEFKECVEPGHKQVSNDSYYPYPTTQREAVWDGANLESGSADYSDLAVIDKDGNLADLKVKVQFYLNTDCDVLRAFHEKIGKTRHAYFNADGTYENGWIWAMTNYIGSSVESLAKAEAAKYSVEDMWLNPATRDEIGDSIDASIQAKVDAGMEGEQQFYKDLKVMVFGASPDADFQALYKERKAAQVKADTAEANKVAQVAEAEAKAAVAQAEAKVRQAEISGYPSVDAYLKAKAIEKGMNPYQPNGTLLTSGK